jgi:acyl-CoA thioesterase II
VTTWSREAVLDQAAADALVRLLDVEALEVNLFRGSSPPPSSYEPQRVFGGQVAGQALVSAARTVERGGVHSLHAYFLRPGDPSIPILYQVDRIRDGRSFTTRRVVAIQHGRAIFNLAASFVEDEPGFEHQEPMPAALPPPDALPAFQERWKDRPDRFGDWYPRPIDVRYADDGADDRVDIRLEPLPAKRHVWFKATGTLPDDPILHTCVLTYASDMTLLETVPLPHRGRYEPGGLMTVSLDHAMWFHHPFRTDEWLLHVLDSPVMSNARGLARGLVYRTDGTLVASVVQEGLVRQLRS